MSATESFDPERHLTAVAESLDLPVPDDARAGAVHYLRLAHDMARLLSTAPLADDGFEQASAFVPGRRAPSEP